jgi:YVTN family beta-propeller protein
MNAFRVLRHVWILLMVAPIPAWASMARVYVTNSAGDSIHVFDPKVVQQIRGIEGAQGIAFSPDGSRVYVSDEVDSTLDVFDRKSGKLIRKVALSAHPNNIAVAKDGRVVFNPAFRRGDRLPVSSQGLDLCTEPVFVSRTRDQMEREEQPAARAFAQLLRRPTLHDKPLLRAELPQCSGDDAAHRLPT